MSHSKHSSTCSSLLTPPATSVNAASAANLRTLQCTLSDVLLPQGQPPSTNTSVVHSLLCCMKEISPVSIRRVVSHQQDLTCTILDGRRLDPYWRVTFAHTYEPFVCVDYAAILVCFLRRCAGWRKLASHTCATITT